MSDKIIVSSILIILAITVLALNIFFVGITVGIKKIQKQAIELNHAVYHPKLGIFVWKTEGDQVLITEEKLKELESK